MKQFLFAAIVSFLVGTRVLSQPRAVYASELEAGSAAELTINRTQEDVRVEKLRSFLESHDSPLADAASHFVAEADRLDMDWKLVAAIAGVESTFGKQIPTNSYNGWGWGVFTGTTDGVHFKDWKDGITHVSEGLRYNYIDKGAETIEQIGRIYAASPAWSWKVRFFFTKIEQFVPSRSDQLAVTI
ncbi:glucosaminidase domain-containing protein [Candidatus Gottesmanbacteria bacterium]|nr:glucosaminidase domain-containing protein [Candidatus Gottesmanbacteria bacterium]